MMKLKIAIHRSRKKFRPKFAHVTGRELHCFRRYRPVRFVLHPVVGLKTRKREGGYVVSELSTLNRISGGVNASKAITNTKRVMAKRTSLKKLLKTIRAVRRDMRSREGRRKYACA